MSIFENFNGHDVSPETAYQGDFSPLPDGDYNVTILTVEERVSKTGNKYVNFSLQVNNGTFKNRYVNDILNLYHPDDTVVEIAFRALEQYSVACSFDKIPADESRYFGKNLTVTIRGGNVRTRRIEASKNSEIKKSPWG